MGRWWGGAALGAFGAVGLGVGIAGEPAGDGGGGGGAGAWRSVRLPANPQELGDAERGLAYLLYGDYIGSGLPVNFFEALRRGSRAPAVNIEREGHAGTLPHDLNLFTMPSGVEVVAGANCLACHAQVFDGDLVIGMGNSLGDWTAGAAAPIDRIEAVARVVFPPESPEYEAAMQFLRGAGKLQGRSDAPFKGVNPAFRFEELAAAHRDPETLAWTEEPVFEVPDRMIATDVPAWWHVKKKNALYYTGLGRGDFTKLLQQITVVGIGDKQDAARINGGMRDLMGFIYTIEPPAYPGPIDWDLASAGKELFEQSCAKCHGTYGDLRGEGGGWTYPNRLVSLEEVGTDPVYARALAESGLHDWFNRSWYATTEPRAWAVPGLGYVAPPLDGVWATAPYFHNGSVPTVEGVLDSGERPAFWRRSFRSDDYDREKLGWRYTVEPGPTDANTYDTTRPGYSNRGHTYGDNLTRSERRAVLEYLKSL